ANTTGISVPTCWIPRLPSNGPPHSREGRRWGGAAHSSARPPNFHPVGGPRTIVQCRTAPQRTYPMDSGSGPPPGRASRVPPTPPPGLLQPAPPRPGDPPPRRSGSVEACPPDAGQPPSTASGESGQLAATSGTFAASLPEGSCDHN